MERPLTMSDPRERRLNEIPRTLLREATEYLWQFTVGFLDVRKEKDKEDAVLLGSGVVVRARNTYAFLTADHVIDVLPKRGRLRLILSARTEQTAIDVSGIQYLRIDRGTDDRAGPDLGAVLLSSEIASAIGAKKSFYSLDSRRDELLSRPPADNEGIWIASGFVEELTRIDPTPDHYVKVKAFCNFGSVGGAQAYEAQEPYDYFQFPIESPEVGAPHDFGGVSGSGVWHVLINERQDKSLVIRKYLLQGIAYYQDAYVKGNSALRCHGTRSIYAAAYGKLAS